MRRGDEHAARQRARRRRDQQHDDRTDRGRRSAHGLHVGVQRRREARVLPHDGGVRRLRRQPRTREHRASSTSTKGRSIRRPGRSRGSASASSIPTANWCRPKRRNTTFAQFNQAADDGAGVGARTAISTRWSSGSKSGVASRWAGRVSYTLLALLRRRRRSSSTAIRASTTGAATATTSTRSRRAPTSTSARGLAPASCSARIPATRSTR